MATNKNRKVVHHGKTTTLLLLPGMLITGCATHPPAKVTTAPTTSAAITQVRLADAKSIDVLASDDVQITLTDKVTLPASEDPIYFGEVDQLEIENPDTAVASIPLIAIHPGSAWKAIVLSQPDLEDAGWKYVGSGPALKEVWGLLDTTVGDPRHNFVVAHSIDGAASFTLTVFHKPCKLAAVSDFTMSRSGRGRITVSLDADCGFHKAGLYHYETIDGGKIWSDPPRYEPDAMIRSDTVPDAEQPGDAPGNTRTLFHTIDKKEPRLLRPPG